MIFDQIDREVKEKLVSLANYSEKQRNRAFVHSNLHINV